MDKKSVAYSLIFRSKEKTLTDEEISDTINSIITSLEEDLNSTLRK